MFFSSFVRCGLIASCVVLALQAAAAEPAANYPNANMRYASVSIQKDSAHNQDASGALSLPFGEHAWAHAGIGKSKAQQGSTTLNPTMFSIGAGIAGSQLAVTLDFSRRNDGDRYRQRDWNSSLDWHNDRYGMGIDAMHRNTDVQAVVAVVNGQNALTNVPVAESIRGNGFGLHGHINATDRISVALGGMHYNYDTTVRQNGGATTNGNGGLLGSIVNHTLGNRSLLAQQLLLQATGVTRDAAILQDSWHVGIGYRLDRAALSAQYFNDRALDGDGAINTVELGAAIFLNSRWTVSPALGRSHSKQLGSVTFGALTASYGW